MRPEDRKLRLRLSLQVRDSKMIPLSIQNAKQIIADLWRCKETETNVHFSLHCLFVCLTELHSLLYCAV